MSLVPGTATDVDRYMDDLQHPLKAGVAQLRAAILASNPAITEHVRWNARASATADTTV